MVLSCNRPLKKLIHLNILALETSSRQCSVALQIDSSIDVRVDDTALSHSRSLLAMIDDLRNCAGFSLADLDCIAVAIGPGSFTGLRIGIAVAQGLAFGYQLPIVPVSSLAMVAYNAKAHWGQHKRGVDVVFATMDARMSEIYCGWYDLRGALPVLLGGEQVLKPIELLKSGIPQLKSPLVEQVNEQSINNLLQSEGAELASATLALSFENCSRASLSTTLTTAIAGGGLHYQAQLIDFYAELAEDIAEIDINPNASALISLAANGFTQGKTLEPETLAPVYLRNNVTY